jgi:two-component system, cell cycle sensor histidine kinase and response regulator CckA
MSASLYDRMGDTVMSSTETQRIAAPSRSSERARILLVEDEPDLRDQLAEALHSGGYDVVAVSDGRVALETARRERPDLILLDLILPVMDGWEFRAAQMREPALALIPVVVMSGSGSAAAQVVDADLVLNKPLTLSAIARAIDEVLAATRRREEQARTAQQERMAALGSLAAGIAHEINNPLTYLFLELERAATLLPTLAASPDPVALRPISSMLATALDGARRIRAVTHAVSEFSRAPETRMVPIDVRDVIEAALVLVANDVRNRARVTRQYLETTAVLADEGRLGQVFLNLLTNAMQAIPEGNVVDNEIKVATTTAPDGRAVVEISDTGHGIPKPLLGRIFDPFFSTKPVGEGSGLGLSISHGIVRSLGGEIEADSEIGAGTTMRVLLPPLSASLQKPPPTPSTEQAADGACRRRRVLVVDDEPMICRAIQYAVAGMHDVVLARSGREALDVLKSDDRFDLILCDLKMPDLSGAELHDALQRERPDVAQRLVLMTGAVLADEPDAPLGLPCPVVTKPMSTDELRALIER